MASVTDTIRSEQLPAVGCTRCNAISSAVKEFYASECSYFPKKTHPHLHQTDLKPGVSANITLTNENDDESSSAATPDSHPHATATSPDSDIAYVDMEPSQPVAEEYDADRLNTPEDTNFWAESGRDGTSGSNKYIHIRYFGQLLSESGIRSLCRRVEVVHNIMRLTVMRIVENQLDNPEVLARYGWGNPTSTLDSTPW